MKKLTINQIIDKLENANIQVGEYKEDNKICGYELNTYTDCGVNQLIFLDFRNRKLNPKKAKDFIQVFNERVNDIDINEEIRLHSEDKRYIQEIGYEVGIQDFKDWKENLQQVFNIQTKPPQQRQFEQVVDKLRSHLEAMQGTIGMMPTKGSSKNDCQRVNILHHLNMLDSCISGI